MPKGKPRRNNHGGHQNGTAGPSAAPQAAAHRRGGTHRVKDEHKTNTIYDEWDYKQLKAECIDREVYIKDMKKVQMARALADNDINKKRAERQAIIDRENKQRLMAREKQREDDRRLKIEAAKMRKRIEKQARRDRDEDVSDDTPDEEELKMMHNEMLGLDADDAGQGQVGQALSDESWDSTSTETTVHSKNPSIGPESRLRLFEWPYNNMPSPTGPPSPSNPARYQNGHIRPKRAPCNVPYIPLKIHTTESKEKLFLPGQTYPPGVDPDYVPVLSQQTRDAARNGVLEGVLRKATIERASAWSDRTRIQGWNGRMYFSLPPRNEEKNLPDVYNKWYLESRRLLRVKPLGDGERVSRQKRHAQRHKNKAKKYAEVLEASEYRPTAVCYLPAYLDFDHDKAKMSRRQRKEEHTLENLFFIRFPGCDVPHYYFWTRRGEWADPTTPNTEWDPAAVLNNDSTHGSENEAAQTRDHSHISSKRLPAPIQTTLTRIKKSSISISPSLSLSPLANTIRRIEHDLYTNGLAATLSAYRTKWLANGKEEAWKAFGCALPLLYPSGQLPSVPPVQATGSVSIAMKIASIDTCEKALLPPLRGDEPWTCDDDTFWDIVQVDQDGDIMLPSTQNDHHAIEPFTPTEVEALYRRASVQLPSRLSTEECAAWLEQISPSYVPLTASTMPGSPNVGLEEWEARFLMPEQKGMDVVCPFCLTDLKGRSLKVSHFNATFEKGLTLE